MKVNPFLRRKVNFINSNRFGLYYMDIRKYAPNSFGGFNYSVYCSSYNSRNLLTWISIYLGKDWIRIICDAKVFWDFSFTCFMAGMEMTIVVNKIIVAWNHGFWWQSERLGKAKEAKQNHYGLYDLCTASILCEVPIFPLKKQMLDFEKVQRTVQRRATSVISNCVRSSQVDWDPPDCKECLRVNVSRTYTIME